MIMDAATPLGDKPVEGRRLDRSGLVSEVRLPAVPL